MTKILQCVSPIDGSVYLERETLAPGAAFSTVARARAAQSDWAARPLQERVDLCLKAVAEVGQTVDRMAIELAHQMGRPVRYGGEFGGFEERALYMGKIAASSLESLVVEESSSFRRLIKREPHGVIFVVAPGIIPT